MPLYPKIHSTQSNRAARDPREVFTDAVRNDPTAIGVGVRIGVGAGGSSLEELRYGSSYIDTSKKEEVLAQLRARATAGASSSTAAGPGPVDTDALKSGATITVPAGAKTLRLSGTKSRAGMPTYVSAESPSPAHARPVGIQASAGTTSAWSYDLPLTGQPGKFELELCVPFATHEDIWTKSGLSHMTVGLSADSTYSRKRLTVVVE